MHYKIFLVKGEIGQIVYVRQTEAISRGMKPGLGLEPTSCRVLSQAYCLSSDVKLIAKNEIFKVGGLDLV